MSVRYFTQEFWEAVYLAAVRAGANNYSVVTPKMIADQAVEDWQASVPDIIKKAEE